MASEWAGAVELRISGTQRECGALIAIIRGALPYGSIEKASRYYPNKRPGEEGTGRVYLTIKAGELLVERGPS